MDYEFEKASFDRVVSIELFEHMKNYELLMAKVARALKPQGKLFVHIFAHSTTPYDFEDGWMSTHFFSGGTMPSADLLHYFQSELKLQEQWWVSGTHYSKTCEVNDRFLNQCLRRLLIRRLGLAVEDECKQEGDMASSGRNIRQDQHSNVVLSVADLLYGVCGAVCVRWW